MSARCDPDFRPLLRPFSRRELDDHPGTVFGTWPDGRLAYVNPAWDRFAAANGGEPAIRDGWNLGVDVFEAIPSVLRPFYRQLYDRSGTSTHPASHEYECSSAGVFRCFHMDVYSLADRRGFVVVHSLLVERPHEDAAAIDALLRDYLDEGGLLHQCAHCRRVEKPGQRRWDWVPAWVERVPAATSHGLCPVCLAYYYPEPEED